MLQQRTMMIWSETVPNRSVRGGLICVAVLLLAPVFGRTAFANNVEAQVADGSTSPIKVYTPGPDVTAPILEYNPDPEFPKSAKLAAGTSVVCVLGLVVDRNGNPVGVHVVRSAGKAFDTNAVRAVREYRFKPGLRHGDPVAVALKVEVRFRAFPKLVPVPHID